MSLFVTIEGVEGSGKSTLRAGLAAALTERNLPLTLTREPGGTDIGQSIRALLLDAANLTMSSAAEAFLFFADRAQHVHEVITPALNAGRIVICDRFCHSTFAYQGFGRGLDLEELKALNRRATGGLHPDLVLLLDLPPESGLARAEKRTKGAALNAGREDSWSRFEEQSLIFHRKVREGFLALAADESERFVILDATKDPDQLVRESVEAVSRALEIKA